MLKRIDSELENHDDDEMRLQEMMSKIALAKCMLKTRI